MAFSASSHQNFGTFNTMQTQGMPGYGFIPPPPYSAPKNEDHPVHRNWNIPCISEDEAREAFLEYASSNCCYSSSPAREMVCEDLAAFNTYRYILETFTESRSLECRTKPYTGKLDIPVVTAELPWNVPVAVPKMFQNNSKEIMMPHTSSIKGCSVCMASGKILCKKCDGSTKEQCRWCKGSGVFISDKCKECSGTGSSDANCSACSGRGRVNCEDCSGHGRLMTYNALVVTWKNHITEYVTHQNNDFPDHLFQGVTGHKLFIDEQNMVYPVTNFPDSSINNASRNAVGSHHTQFISNSRILRQRQTIEHIPLTRVEYRWHGKPFSFYVYGNERQVHTKDYPQKTCCTII
ncbi:protein SSUH2 homolog isoform X2 [Paroedura picta]|uniref:protein SSUH2 homolog isoform X2 n=1 Tax=Paroedura picta TaxID=143630 RepID=UPI004057706B